MASDEAELLYRYSPMFHDLLVINDWLEGTGTSGLLKGSNITMPVADLAKAIRSKEKLNG